MYHVTPPPAPEQAAPAEAASELPQALDLLTDPTIDLFAHFSHSEAEWRWPRAA